MLLVCLEDCKPCEELREKHPNIPYVILPRRAGYEDKDVYEVKKAIGLMGVTEFPVLLNDGLNRILPMTLLEESKESDTK
jgi:hypothetical protein